MSLGSSNVQVNKLELTPQRISLNGVDLGATLENVEVTLEVQKAELKADQTGVTVRDRRISGISVSLKTKLAQTQDVETWAKAFPSFSKGVAAIEGRLQIGRSDTEFAGEMILHPLNRADSDKSQDLLFFAVQASEMSGITYGPEEQSALEITWNAYITGSNAKIFRFGDPDEVIV